MAAASNSIRYSVLKLLCAAELVKTEVSPITYSRNGAECRRKMCGVLLSSL